MHDARDALKIHLTRGDSMDCGVSVASLPMMAALSEIEKNLVIDYGGQLKDDQS
jgi:hypothetical protein